MKFIDLFEKDDIQLNAPFISKKRLFEYLAQLMSSDERVQMAIYQSFVEREKLGNTSLGNGVAIPHGTCLESDREVIIRLVKLSTEADYESLDEVPVRVVLAIAFPVKIKPFHQQIMKEAVALFKQHILYKGVIQAESQKEIIQLILEMHQQCNNWSS